MFGIGSSRSKKGPGFISTVGVLTGNPTISAVGMFDDTMNNRRVGLTRTLGVASGSNFVTTVGYLEDPSNLYFVMFITN